MSSYGIAGPPNQSSPKFLKTWHTPIPLTLPNFVALRQKCARYPLSKICAPGKRGPKFTKIGDELLRTNAPRHAIFHRARQTMHQKKSYKFCPHPSVFWRSRGDPLGQRSPIWLVMYSKATSIKLSNFVDFVVGVTQTQKQ